MSGKEEWEDQFSQEFDFSLYYEQIISGVRLILSDPITKASAITLTFIVGLGIFGPYLTPFHYTEQFYHADGSLMRGLPPLSGPHLLGTTSQGQDVLSRLVYGARPTILVGIGSGLIIITLGTLVGVIAGYFGGVRESVLMRLVDFWYVIPLIPFAIVLLVFFEIGLFETILILGFILWRGSARVLRSQVLQIKERPFIESIRATGASDTHIILKHIIPNVSSMIVFFLAVGIGVSILAQANLAFLGISDPYLPTWGVMVRNAYVSGNVAHMWWWSLPPGFLIGLTVLCTYLIGRGYERLSSRRSVDQSSVEGSFQ